MGMRLHVISKIEEYGDTSAFNNRSTDFFLLLEKMGCPINAQVSDCDECGFYELMAEDYEEAMGEVFDYAATSANTEHVEAIKWFCEKTNYTPKELYETMNQFYAERDKNLSDWIQFRVW